MYLSNLRCPPLLQYRQKETIETKNLKQETSLSRYHPSASLLIKRQTRRVTHCQQTQAMQTHVPIVVEAETGRERLFLRHRGNVNVRTT